MPRRFNLVTGLFGLCLVASQAWADAPAGAPAPKNPPAAAPTPSTTATSEVDALVDSVQAFYDKAKTFKAHFKQRYSIAAYDKSKDSEGSVAFEKAGKMSWRYTSNQNRVVSDGKVLKIYEAENKQMYEQDVNKSQYPAALSFLMGTGNLKTAFKFQKLAAADFPGGHVLVGTPLEQTPAYQQMVLYVDAKTFQVRRVLLIDAQKNKNRFDFSQPTVNEKIPAAEFQFTPPPNTRVIRP
ncbi:MAG TPA: outer membrane lipoprotein carrier protein LolA [Polyangiaceae bacterium]|nr:outer membrane lipoprotein carrier protein LolA [Polyangiaceae bacterium]